MCTDNMIGLAGDYSMLSLSEHVRPPIGTGTDGLELARGSVSWDPPNMGLYLKVP